MCDHHQCPFHKRGWVSGSHQVDGRRGKDVGHGVTPARQGEGSCTQEGLPETQGLLCCFDVITLDASEMIGYILNDTIDISKAWEVKRNWGWSISRVLTAPTVCEDTICLNLLPRKNYQEAVSTQKSCVWLGLACPHTGVSWVRAIWDPAGSSAWGHPSQSHTASGPLPGSRSWGHLGHCPSGLSC